MGITAGVGVPGDKGLGFDSVMWGGGGGRSLWSVLSEAQCPWSSWELFILETSESRLV